MIFDDDEPDDAEPQTDQLQVYRDGKVHLLAEKCDACLLSPGRIVSGARAAQIVRDTRDEDGAAFVCHKAQIAEKPAICRGWYDKFADRDAVLRLAAYSGVIQEQDAEGNYPVSET